ncbi:MAG TPA: lysozyme inhibitor LprI family protein [Phnomibacter sp.]|nr:lysozyme inhibitor LprI family protein [Phnomibacter sp.]
MRYLILISGLLLFQAVSFSQSKNAPVEVTPTIEKKINQEIEKEVALLKATLTKAKESATSIEFAIDTFRIERYYEKYMDYDYTTAGMSSSTYNVANKYDSLLNKYYKRFLSVLAQKDKAVLVNAQKSWIAFRDNELKLVSTISKDEYSGGGTMQQLVDASEYLDIIKQRTIAIYLHYLRATQDY